MAIENRLKTTMEREFWIRIEKVDLLMMKFIRQNKTIDKEDLKMDLETLFCLCVFQFK